MNYRETLDFLYSSLPVYQRIGGAAYKSDLDTTIHFDNHLGNPHTSFKSIHVAGTNGKGSVSHMLASVLQESGYKTGLYTSPHLRDFRERIKIDGEPVGKDYVVAFIEENREIIERLEPSFFEMTVAMAFKYFSDQEVDIAVIETGMGGRLDSTNIVRPLLSVITNIGLDHTQFLGNDLATIAAEKGGIIKPGIPVLIGETSESTINVFKQIAIKQNSGIFFAEDSWEVSLNHMQAREGLLNIDILHGGDIYLSELVLDNAGQYQLLNLRTLIAAIDLLGRNIKIEKSAVRNGLLRLNANTGLEGRWQVLEQQPLVICDTAHNREGLKVVLEQLDLNRQGKLFIILGFVNDKDFSKLLALFPEDAEYFFTRAEIPRALDPSIIVEEAHSIGLKGSAYNTVMEAYEEAMGIAGKEDTVFIGGSTFVVADLLNNCYPG